jgi:hypothetical protein
MPAQTPTQKQAHYQSTHRTFKDSCGILLAPSFQYLSHTTHNNSSAANHLPASCANWILSTPVPHATPPAALLLQGYQHHCQRPLLCERLLQCCQRHPGALLRCCQLLPLLQPQLVLHLLQQGPEQAERHSGNRTPAHTNTRTTTLSVT